MKTIKILNIAAGVFGVLFIISTITLFIMKPLNISCESLLGLIILSCFSFSWLIAFVCAYEASEREIKLERSY